MSISFQFLIFSVASINNKIIVIFLSVMKFAVTSVTFDLLILELMFLFFKNTVKKTKIQVYILLIS